ncbi:MAG TPA: hypothetical protein VLH39_01950, partial [Magnetospirillaceae bacterium]|nr:hypothetical protein [Magnetospirillaceae bacterium]
MATFERREGHIQKKIDIGIEDQDLDQYGIWVKAEPQDVLEEKDTEVPSRRRGAPVAAAVPEDSFLTEEEETFLGAEGGMIGRDSGRTPNGIGMPFFLEEELSIPDLDEAPLGVQKDFPRIPDMAGFESMEDLGIPIEEFKPDSRAQKPLSPEAFQDVTDFGLDELESDLGIGPAVDLEAMDLDLKFDDTLPPRPAGPGGITDSYPSSVSGSFETVTDFDEFLNNPETQPDAGFPAAGTPGIQTTGIQDADFSLEDIPELAAASPIDDVAELERELAAPSAARASVQRPDASTEILLKIAGELSSIKQELVSLKSQIAAMKTATQAGTDASQDGRKPDDGNAGGFFDEEEDETIALTGDELDNILNTAEFSEVKAPPVTEPLENILPETGDYALDRSRAERSGKAGIEELRLPEEPAPDLPPHEAEAELDALAEEGILPLTVPPEDISYLEDDEDEIHDLDAVDGLPEAPLLEPTPEELDIDDLLDDKFGETEELPLAEFESADRLIEPAELEEEPEELEELTLELDSEPIHLTLETPENITLPIPEIEDAASDDAEYLEMIPDGPAEEADAFGEIALHEEESLGSDSEAVLEELEPADLEPADLEPVD